MLGDKVSELLTLQSYLHFKESLNQEVCGHAACRQSTLRTTAIKNHVQTFSEFGLWPLHIKQHHILKKK